MHNAARAASPWSSSTGFVPAFSLPRHGLAINDIVPTTGRNRKVRHRIGRILIEVGPSRKGCRSVGALIIHDQNLKKLRTHPRMHITLRSTSRVDSVRHGHHATFEIQSTHTNHSTRRVPLMLARTLGNTIQQNATNIVRATSASIQIGGTGGRRNRGNEGQVVGAESRVIRMGLDLLYQSR